MMGELQLVIYFCGENCSLYFSRKDSTAHGLPDRVITGVASKKGSSEQNRSHIPRRSWREVIETSEGGRKQA